MTSYNGLELGLGKFIGAEAVRGYLKAIFEERDSPTDQNDLPKSFATIEMAIPSEGHKDVGDGEKEDRAQEKSFLRAQVGRGGILIHSILTRGPLR